MPRAADLPGDLREVPRDRLRVREQPLPGLGQGHAATLADVQRLPELVLQGAQLPAHGRLAEVQGLPGAADTAQFRDDTERDEMLRVDPHARMVSARPIGAGLGGRGITSPDDAVTLAGITVAGGHGDRRLRCATLPA